MSEEDTKNMPPMPPSTAVSMPYPTRARLRRHVEEDLLQPTVPDVLDSPRQSPDKNHLRLFDEAIRGASRGDLVFAMFQLVQDGVSVVRLAELLSWRSTRIAALEKELHDLHAVEEGHETRQSQRKPKSGRRRRRGSRGSSGPRPGDGPEVKRNFRKKPTLNAKLAGNVPRFASLEDVEREARDALARSRPACRTSPLRVRAAVARIKERGMLTTPEAAKHIGISSSGVQYAARDGRLRATYVNGVLAYRPEDVKEFAKVRNARIGK